MKKRFLILAVIIFLGGCKDVYNVEEDSTKVEDIFTLNQSRVLDGSLISFNLPAEGTYILTLIDSQNNNIVTRERFKGKPGLNKMNVYSKSLSSKSFYLLLEDDNRFQIGKTLILLQ